MFMDTRPNQAPGASDVTEVVDPEKDRNLSRLKTSQA
jgi:hypothetical protein